MSTHSKRLIWLDLEMTGLDTFNDTIIEIATVVTDGNLEVIAEGPSLAIHQDDSVLDSMDNWNKKQHSQSGLLARVKKSNLTIADAEKMTLNFLKKITNKEESPMCGNTICQDRRFLARLMPELESHFNYRNLDVTSIKITSQLWNPEVARSHSKNSNHLAMDDVYDSIHELRHYKKHLLIEK
ncbi:MAG: oligoribonuclease [Gammaproteobacteria bacterium]|nr:oligoribonuclease [Gammaproteobacteria bacterium]